MWVAISRQIAQMQILCIYGILFKYAIAKNLAGLLNDFFLQYYGPGDEQIGDTLKIWGLYAISAQRLIGEISISGVKGHPRWPGTRLDWTVTWGRGWKKTHFEFWRLDLVSRPGATFKTRISAPKKRFWNFGAKNQIWIFGGSQRANRDQIWHVICRGSKCYIQPDPCYRMARFAGIAFPAK